MLIYNCVSTNDAPVSLDSYYYHAGINARKYLIKNCYWLPTVTLVTNKIVYAICNWFCHMLPALLMDIYERFTGATPRYLNICRVYWNNLHWHVILSASEHGKFTKDWKLTTRRSIIFWCRTGPLMTTTFRRCGKAWTEMTSFCSISTWKVSTGKHFWKITS